MSSHSDVRPGSERSAEAAVWGDARLVRQGQRRGAVVVQFEEMVAQTGVVEGRD